jgi:hypothetical protein
MFRLDVAKTLSDQGHGSNTISDPNAVSTLLCRIDLCYTTASMND